MPRTTTRRRHICATSGLIAALLTLALAPMAPAQAADKDAPKSTWSVQPSTKDGPTKRTSFDRVMAPGSSAVDYVGVTNYSNKPLTLTVYATDAFNTAEGGTDALAGSTKPVGVGSWITLKERKVTLAPKSRQDIPFRITVPSDATPGDHPGAILAALAVTTDNGDGGEITVDRRVGSRVNVRVLGELSPDLDVKVTGVTYSPSINPASGTLTVNYAIDNDGNLTLGAKQSVQVKAGGLIVVADATPTDLTGVLPGQSVTQSVRIEGVPAGVWLTAEVTLEPISTDGQGLPTITASGSTIAIPWSLLVFVFIVAAAVVITRRLRRRSAVRREREIAQAVEAAHIEATMGAKGSE